MPVLRISDIRSMPPEERMKKLDELRAELVRVRTTIEAGGTVENPARVREIRHAIARILTVEREGRR